MTAYGQRELCRGCKGEDVRELQIRLAGFRGTVPDGDFGPGTELQVMTFQRDFMQMDRQPGRVDEDTFKAIAGFAAHYPFDFQKLMRPCGQCQGFGLGRFKGKYRAGKPVVEAYCRYEYPGIHRMLLLAVRALQFYLPEHRFVITSGYRCSICNTQERRTSTNHHGKAIDLDVLPYPGENKRDDMHRCESIRGLLVEKANAQIGWLAVNRKSLEPGDIAPTWIHYDVRAYEKRFLQDHFFCKSLEALDVPMGSLP